MAETRYRIGTAARLAGVTTHAVRVWERRYGVLAPNRSDGGARLYSDDDVLHLKLLKRVVDNGHPIGQVARLERSELQRLAAPSVADRPPVVAAEPMHATEDERLLEELVAAVERFDALRAERLMALAQARYSARVLVRDVFAPLLTRIGDAWAQGKLCAASEHAASVLVRDRAGALLRQFQHAPGGKLLVASTPAGELHELGALLASVTAAMQGWEVMYLGPNLPASEIATAARSTNADVVALSVVALEVKRAARELDALQAALPRGVKLVLGGQRASAVSKLLEREVVVPASLDDFEHWLAAHGSGENGSV